MTIEEKVPQTTKYSRKGRSVAVAPVDAAVNLKAGRIFTRLKLSGEHRRVERKGCGIWIKVLKLLKGSLASGIRLVASGEKPARSG